MIGPGNQEAAVVKPTDCLLVLRPRKMLIVGDNLITNLLRRAADRITISIRGREGLAVDVSIPVIPGNGKAFVCSRNLGICHMDVHRGIDPELVTVRGPGCVVALTEDTVMGAAINARMGRMAGPGDNETAVIKRGNRRVFLGSRFGIDDRTVAILRCAVAAGVDQKLVNAHNRCVYRAVTAIRGRECLGKNIVTGSLATIRTAV